MWFEAIRKKTGRDESWEKMCLSDAFENYNGDNYLNPRLLRKWRYGEKVPKPKTVKKFFQCLFPEDKYSKDELIQIFISWYFARTFQHIYCILDHLIHREKPVYSAESKDIVEFFEEYNDYFNSLAEEYENLAAV